MDPTQKKIIVSIMIILVGLVVTVALCNNTHVSERQSSGTIIDFEEYDTVWTETSTDGKTAKEVLEYSCKYNGFSLTFDESGNIEEINGIFSSGTASWELWVIEKGSKEWKKLPTPYSMSLSGYKVSSWAYRSEGEDPTVALDSSGESIYGYSQKQRTITLSPALTEIIGSLNGASTLVGTDIYSNYPESVVKWKKEGRIAIVGDYTTPSFEAIIKAKPDVVFCDGSQYNHIQVCQRLKDAGVCAILMYDGTSSSVIKDNVFIMGKVMGYDMASKERIDSLDYAMAEIEAKLAASEKTKVVDTAITLSGDMSPWVSGKGTFSNDILVVVCGKNVFEGYNGWVHINSEKLVTSNPSKIIVLNSDYKATQQDYDAFIASLSNEWKATDAYKNGEIYLITESAGDVAQRPATRYAQFAELTARILNPDVFDDIEMSKFIGDNYRDFLTYTKNLG